MNELIILVLQKGIKLIKLNKDYKNFKIIKIRNNFH